MIDGKISEDDKKTWLTIEEFKKSTKISYLLTFDEANEMSLEEIQTIDAIDDPIWEELDKKREEYIQTMVNEFMKMRKMSETIHQK